MVIDHELKDKFIQKFNRENLTNYLNNLYEKSDKIKLENKNNYKFNFINEFLIYIPENKKNIFINKVNLLK